MLLAMFKLRFIGIRANSLGTVSHNITILFCLCAKSKLIYVGLISFSIRDPHPMISGFYGPLATLLFSLSVSRFIS
jgi:hypothetical protein